jgi:hypothetical protein
MGNTLLAAHPQTGVKAMIDLFPIALACLIA